MTQDVVIVGGGASGWMTAAYLNKAFPDLGITVVESDRIGTIGVGESTFSTIKVFFDFLGLKESDWMHECCATYKLAIKFVDWAEGQGPFYHPFQRFDTVDGFNTGEWWLRVRPDMPFDRACFTVAELCDQKRSPRYMDGSVFDDNVRSFFDGEGVPRLLSEHHAQYPYGYHFDALLFSRYMMRHAMARGVRRVVDDVVDVRIGEDGAIAAIETRAHGDLRADLYVDCTGFRGLLINEALKEPFIPFGEYLLTDRAVAIQIPNHIDRDGIRPYTTATAMSSGWSWSIPLYSRNGTGYVYSSAFLSPEEAEQELRAHVGPAADGMKPNHLKMRVGRCRNSWVKNCVAIGLSSGFVEPLESSGIFFIQHNIEELVAHFPGKSIDETAVRSFNRIVGNCIDGVRDFLVLHYRASNRDDTPFWRAARTVPVPETLEERLNLWKTRLPTSKNIAESYHGFEAYSYAVIVLGLGYNQLEPLPTLARRPDAEAQEFFRQIRARSELLAQSLPSQQEYLASAYEPVRAAGVQMPLDA